MARRMPLHVPTPSTHRNLSRVERIAEQRPSAQNCKVAGCCVGAMAAIWYVDLRSGAKGGARAIPQGGACTVLSAMATCREYFCWQARGLGCHLPLVPFHGARLRTETLHEKGRAGLLPRVS